MKLTLIFILSLVISAGAQDDAKFLCDKIDKQNFAEYLNDRSKIEAIAAKFKEPRKNTLSFCRETCAVSLPKPFVPETAKNYRFSGRVLVKAIADVNGRIFYARPVSGPMLLRGSAHAAACRSQFRIVLSAGKQILFPWIIAYSFI